MLARTAATVAGVAAAVLVSGCTRTASGSAVAAADLGHAPKPVAVSTLGGLLLPVEQLDSVLQIQGLVLERTAAAGYSGKTRADDCAASWMIAFMSPKPALL